MGIVGSVIIPAHNEARVIGRCLTNLLDGLPGDVEIVVVANGCSDETAAAARNAAPSATVIEIPEASKSRAIRVGEAAAPRLPRVFLDADVVVSGQAIAQTLRALDSGAVAARPPLRYLTEGSTWPVKRYYRARSALPCLMDHAWGAGVYGLSREGRSRFGEFPDVVGDDLFVDSLLHDGELVVIDCEPVGVVAPRDSGRTLRILRRAQRTKGDVLTSGPRGAAPRVGKELRRLALSGPGGFVDAAVYGAFALAARSPTLAGSTRWERDDSTR